METNSQKSLTTKPPAAAPPAKEAPPRSEELQKLIDEPVKIEIDRREQEEQTAKGKPATFD